VQKGAQVTMTGRSAPSSIPKGATFVKSDVGTLKGASELVQNDLKGKTFDTVVFCVGIITRPVLTRNSEGIEEDLATSYLSRFVISNKLIKANALVGRKRLYIMGYPGEDIVPTDIDDINIEKTEYKQFPVHLNTVALNEALVFELARRHPDLHVFGLNPGLIKTGIRDNVHGGSSSILGTVIETMIGLFTQTTQQYVERALIHLVASPELDNQSGISFTRKAAYTSVSKWMSDPANRLKAWDNSERLATKVLGSL